MAGQYFRDLAAVTTAPETAILYGVSRRTVLDWCNEGKVAAVKIGHVWIISTRSLVDKFGFPPNLPDARDSAENDIYTEIRFLAET